MSDGRNRVVPHHARTGIVHRFTHLLLHVGLIAMDRTLFASWFLLPKLAVIQTLVSVVE